MPSSSYPWRSAKISQLLFQAWKSKASAIHVIAPALAEYVLKNDLPVAKVKCKETGISNLKTDWSRFVEDNLPSAKQVKEDARSFKNI